MKNILHVIDTTGPGGAETVFLDLIAGLPESEFKSFVHIRGKGWVYDQLCGLGIEPILLDAKGSFNWRYLIKLLDVIKGNKIDLIQSHLLGSNIYCSLAGMLSGTPVVATFHGAVDIGESERFKTLKFGIINRGACDVVAVSNNLREDMIARTPIKPELLSVIYNGIVTANFQHRPSSRIRDLYNWSDDKIIVGSLGNIRSAKGYAVLLKAAAVVKEKQLPIRFVIAGQGGNGLHDDLLKLRSDLELEETVYFLGFNDDPAEFLSNLDIFLLSSLSEGFSISTIQAMASQLPVVVTKSGGPEEIVTQRENGILVECNNPQAIADALQELVNDKSLAEKLSCNARSHAIETFDIHKMLNHYMAIYKKELA